MSVLSGSVSDDQSAGSSGFSSASSGGSPSGSPPDEGFTLRDRMREVVDWWSRSQYRLVTLAADFADSGQWALEGASTAAHWIAEAADVEICTAREWIRIGRQLRELPVTAEAFRDGRLSYSKVRTLSRIATEANEAELVALAEQVSAGHLGRALAAWSIENEAPDVLARRLHRQRSLSWRNEPDGMVTFTLRLPPRPAAAVIALLNTTVMQHDDTTSESGERASADEHPTLAQQRADAFEKLVSAGGGQIDTEVVVHIRGDGCTFDDGTPVAAGTVATMIPGAFIRTLIHDAEGRPINASFRRRYPTTRQKRVVKERDRCCVDCGREDLLQHDHVPPYEQTKHTLVEELELRCAPCHRRRHARSDGG